MPFAGYPGIGPWEFGGEMKWPRSEYDQCPSTEPAVRNEEEAWALKPIEHEKLKRPATPPTSSNWLEFQLNTECLSICLCTAHGRPPGNIVGIERLCRWAFKKKDLAHHVMRVATQFLITFNQIIVDEVGPEIYIPGNSTASASNDLISPKTFEEFAPSVHDRIS